LPIGLKRQLTQQGQCDDGPVVEGYDFICPLCSRTGQIAELRGGTWCPDPRCAARVMFTQRGGTEIHVTGQYAAEVEAVTRQLAADMTARQEAAKLRSPWFSGLFYLTVVVVVVVLMLAVSRLVSAWALPVAIAGAVLLVSVVGALQLRQDDRLNERNFLTLMGHSLRRLPVLFGRSRKNPPEDN
jgi:hypothetical protein